MTDPTVKVNRLYRSVYGMLYRRDNGKNQGRNAASSDGTLQMRVRELMQAMAELPDDPAGDKLYDKANVLVRRYYGLEARPGF